MLLPRMRIKKALTTLLVLLVMLIVALPLAFLTYAHTCRSKTVLFRVEETGDPVGTPFIFILNPFRDRSAEDTAAAFLEKDYVLYKNEFEKFFPELKTFCKMSD